eukprot:194844_1
MAALSKDKQAEDKKLSRLLINAGFANPKKIANTLQGSIWRIPVSKKPSTGDMIVKITNKDLHSKSMGVIGDVQCRVSENIDSEINIHKHLSSDESKDCMVQYIDSFETDKLIFMFLSDGGSSLFDFVFKAHHLIHRGDIEMAEWHKACKVIFKQMIDFVEYIHSMNVCHFDISLENFLINTNVGVKIKHYPHGEKLCFITDEMQIKGCDFGLAELFPEEGEDSEFNCSKYCGKMRYQGPEIVEKKKDFNAKSNDVFCLGVCLFMMCVGCCPWTKASQSCESFVSMMNGDILEWLSKWDRLAYVDQELVDLFACVFRYEDKRCGLETLKQSRWLNSD